MSEIRLSDQATLDVTLTPNAASAFTKYIKTPMVSLVAAPAVAVAWQRPLRDQALQQAALGFNFKDKVEFGTGAPELTVQAGVKALANVNDRPGTALFAQEFFGDPITVPDGQAYVSFSTTATLGAHLTGAEQDLSFGFDAGGTVTTETYRLFGLDETLGDAITGVLTQFVLPGDVADLRAMPPGTIAAVSGNGQFSVSGAFAISTAANPLVLPTGLPGVGSLQIKSGASVNVRAAAKVSGAYQIRVQKLDNQTVRLGYYRKRGSELSVSVTARASASVSAGGFDLAEKIMGSIHDPAAEPGLFTAGGLSEAQAAAVDKAIQGSVNRTLETSLSAALNSVREEEAAFLYEVRLSQLNDQAREALHLALDGDLSGLTEQEEQLSTGGITVVRSVIKTLRKRTVTLKLNLLGVFNFLSLREFVLKGKVLFEPQTGQLVITDEATAQRIQVASLPLAADGAKLRAVLSQSALMTAAYRAGGALPAVALTSECSHFEFHQDTNRQAMKDNLDAVEAAGLISTADKQRMLEPPRFGRSTFFLGTEFDDECCRTMFLDDQNQPRTLAEFETIGRTALLRLLEDDTGDANLPARRRPLTDDLLWKRMKEVGQFNFGTLPGMPNTTLGLELIAGDFSRIVWWAGAMRGAAERLAKVREFLQQNPQADLRHDNRFKILRSELAQHLAAVVSNASARFGDPWGVIALDLAAQRKDAATAVIQSPALMERWTRAMIQQARE